jgi:tetrahydromethanopterin S-methyltransferase subunit E
MTPRRILFLLLQIAATLQVVVGIAMWTGHWYSLRGMHMAVGVSFVLMLWAIAIMALVQRRRIPVALLALAWGVVVVAVGITQQGLLPGDLHWIIRVLHLVIGLASMPLAAMLTVGLEVKPRPV